MGRSIRVGGSSRCLNEGLDPGDGLLEPLLTRAQRRQLELLVFVLRLDAE
jgi:hypothetical protein